MAGADYTLDATDADHPVLRLTDISDTWPLGTRAWSPFSVRFTVGYGTSETDVPNAIRMAVGELVALAKDNRGALSAELSPYVRDLIAPYVVYGNTPGAE